MLGRVLRWSLRIVFGLLAAFSIALAALIIFPLGCPISKHLPNTVTEVQCKKHGNFPEMWYKISAVTTRAEFDTFLATLQVNHTAAPWDVQTKGDEWIAAKYHTNAVILGAYWLKGEANVDLRAY